MAIQEVISELNRIQEGGLISAYAIGGAVAAQAYIETSSTEDVDVFVVFGRGASHPLDPLAPIWGDLIKHGAKPDGLYLVIGGWPVQFLQGESPLYDDAIKNALSKDFGTQKAMIMSPVYLATIALATGREKDYPRVAEFIKAGKVDVGRLSALVEPYGLSERWNTFKTRFPSANV
jgi:hypothetical protein